MVAQMEPRRVAVPTKSVTQRKVLEVHEAQRVVQRLAIDRHPGIAARLERRDDIFQRVVLGHRFDVGARRHHVLDAQVAQPQDIVHHCQFGRRAGAEGRTQRIRVARRVITIGLGRTVPAEKLPDPSGQA